MIYKSFTQILDHAKIFIDIHYFVSDPYNEVTILM